MTKLFVKPRDGALVRHPLTKQPLSQDGAVVDLSNSYWKRRERDGDIVIATPKKTSKKKVVSKSKSKSK